MAFNNVRGYELFSPQWSITPFSAGIELVNGERFLIAGRTCKKGRVPGGIQYTFPALAHPGPSGERATKRDILAVTSGPPLALIVQEADPSQQERNCSCQDSEDHTDHPSDHVAQSRRGDLSSLSFCEDLPPREFHIIGMAFLKRLIWVFVHRQAFSVLHVTLSI
jgi:hypothetical protein